MTLRKSWAGFLQVVAHVVGFSASAFFLFFALGEGLPEIVQGHLVVLPILLSLLVASMGLVISLRNQHLGSLIILLGSVLIASSVLWLAGQDGFWVMALFAGPFVFSGIVLLWISRKRGEV